MCTAITYQTNHFYFGRNLDLERSYEEMVVITPRAFPFRFRNGTYNSDHYAMIGMAAVADNYPLYFDASNEMGLSMAGLNFPGNAVYNPSSTDQDNVCPFELIPWILCQCENSMQAKRLLENMNLWDEPFHNNLPNSPLHWILADKMGCYTIESTTEGLKIYDNPIGILTNNPTFDYHMQNLSNYMSITAKIPENRFSNRIDLSAYSLGMGALGLPGDPSSASRFVKATFTKMNSISGNTEEEDISQFFHILKSVEQQKGITMVPGGEFEYTMYSSCCETDSGKYYFTTYENSRVRCVDMFKESLISDNLICYERNQPLEIMHLN